jgi:hypothetical protein
MADNQHDTEKEIRIVIDGSLLKHIMDGMKALQVDDNPRDVITSFVEDILNNSDFPMAARRTGENEVRVSYHLHSFSQPFFE